MARNLDAELAGKALEAFTFHEKGFVVSVAIPPRGRRRGWRYSTGGRLAHLLKDAIEWEYRQSVRHLRGWDPIGVRPLTRTLGEPATLAPGPRRPWPPRAGLG